MIALTILIAALIILSAAVKFSETAVIAFDRDRAEEEGNVSKYRFRHIIKLQDDPENLLGFSEAVKMLLLAGSSGAAVFLIAILFPEVINGDSWVITALAYAGGITSAVILFSLFGVLIPQAIGKKFAQQLAPAVATPLFFFVRASLTPLKIFSYAADLLLKPFGTKSSFSPLHISEEQILALIHEGLKTGAIDEAEHDILENVFEFNDLKANEVMVPRTEMIAVQMSSDNEKVFRDILKTGHSLVPVYENSLDTIIGVVHIKDMMRQFVDTGKVEVASLLRPAYFVPETKLISEILRDMQQRGERITMVTDEYGGTEGVITLEDILSEIVGTINGDEPKAHEVVKMPDGRMLVLGSMDIDDFNELFQTELPESDKFTTIAGFVSYQTGKILNAGETYEYEGIRFELVKKLRQKMVQFRVGRTGRKKLDIDPDSHLISNA